MPDASATDLPPTIEPGQGAPPSVTALRTPNPLREIFADLISYVLLFRSICADRPPAPNAVRESIDRLIAEQERRVKAGEASWDSYREGLFAALSWTDEVVLNSPWPYRNEWRHLMLGSFGTLNAGKEFFSRLEALPAASLDVKEIYFLCLSLGFEGTFALGEKPEQLREYRRRLYRDIATRVAIRRDRVFPEAYGRQRRVARVEGRRIGAAWFSLAVLIPALLFGVYWYLLHRQTGDLLARLATPTATPVSRARTLVELLRDRGIQAEQAARGVVITLPNVLFTLNSAQLSPEGERQIKEVAAALQEHAPGVPVLVEGHASREKTTAEETNQRLSEDRATNVVALLKEAGLRNERVTAKGFGSKSPIAANDTEEGRAKNRRVEIIVENVK
jgi:type VI secretion system protein ImpK